MNNKELIDHYIKRLNLDEKLFCEVSNFLMSINEDSIVSNKESVAKLFCLNISRLDQDTEVIDELAKIIMNSFKNIGKMEISKDSSGNVRTIGFLNELFSKRDKFKVKVNLEDENLGQEFGLLLENLEQIRIVFNVKINNEIQFPISRLLSAIIESESFIGDISSITAFRTLILALQIFQHEGYTEEKASVTKLVKDYNLRSIDYIMNDGAIKIGESSWNYNFDRNGTLILHNRKKNKILIRNIDKNYFTNPIGKSDSEIKIEYEINQKHKHIACFYEYDLKPGFEFKSVENFFCKDDDFEETKDLLQLIFDKQCCNIFHKQALILFEGKLYPVNPFLRNDKYICNMKNRMSVNNLESAIDILKNYSLQILKGQGIDCATVGLILELMSIKLVCLSKILSKIDRISSNIQNSIIKVWLEECEEKNICFNRFVSQFEKNLEYVRRLDTFKNKKFGQESFYPIKLDETILNMVDLCTIYQEYKYKLIETETDYDLKISYKSVTDNTQITAPIIDHYDKEEVDYLKYNKKFYALYNLADNKMIVGKEIDINYRLLERVKNGNKYLIDYQNLLSITNGHIDLIKKLMLLHKSALMESSGLNISFESLVKYKLINNLLCFHIIPDKINNYFRLLDSHSIVDYSIVKEDETIQNIPPGTLVVPKERSNTQSVLKDIFNEYVKKNAERNRIDFYDSFITKEGDYYFTQGKKINRILFVFDLTQSGTATIGALRYYLGNNQKKEKKRQEFYCDGKQITVKNIIDKNLPSITVHSFYSSEKGLKEIQQFAKNNGLDIDIKDSVGRIANRVTTEVLEIAHDLFGEIENCVKIGDYIVIREFNQPKKNIFPKYMLEPQNVVSLFVKKPEI